MYRTKTLEEISGMITVYNTVHHKPNITVDSTNLDNFLNNPTLPSLITIIKGGDDALKKAILTTLNCNINYTSIKPFIGNDVVLFNLLHDIDLAPMYNKYEIKAIMEYIKTKSNTSVIAKHQANDVADFFSRNGFANTVSAAGATDIDFTGRKAVAKADGVVMINGAEVIVYLRYGSSSGGSQNDRWRGMFSTASRHKDNMFIFVVDGVEALQQYKLCKEEFAKDDYPNAIWTTVKYLNFIDFDGFRDTWTMGTGRDILPATL